MGNWFNLFQKRHNDSQVKDVNLVDVWNRYCAEWPGYNDHFKTWKPASVLPASKELVASAVMQAYRNWPDKIGWEVFSAFATEYADIAMHLPVADYEAVKPFQREFTGRVGRDPYAMFCPQSATAALITSDQLTDQIKILRDRFASHVRMGWKDAPSNTVERARSILLTANVEFSSRIEEWRYFILSIGREGYVNE